MRNYQCRLGEIDLIMRDRDCLVFVEVRFRSAKRFVTSVLTVDERKQQKLARAAELFLSSRPALAGSKTRFDVVGVDRDANGSISVEWLRDAFWL
jgi:putative endonuclease